MKVDKLPYELLGECRVTVVRDKTECLQRVSAAKLSRQIRSEWSVARAITAFERRSEVKAFQRASESRPEKLGWICARCDKSFSHTVTECDCKRRY